MCVETLNFCFWLAVNHNRWNPKKFKCEMCQAVCNDLRLFFFFNYYTEDQTRIWFQAPACCCVIQAPHEYNGSLPAVESKVFKIDRDCLKGKLITSDCEGQQFCIWPSRHRPPQTASGSVWAQLGARGENIYQEFTFKCLPRFLILDPWFWSWEIFNRAFSLWPVYTVPVRAVSYKNMTIEEECGDIVGPGFKSGGLTSVWDRFKDSRCLSLT